MNKKIINLNLNENKPSSKKLFSNNIKCKNNIHTNYTPKSKKSFKNKNFDIDLDNQSTLIKKKNTHDQPKNDIDQKNNDSQIKNNINEKKIDSLILNNNNTKTINKTNTKPIIINKNIQINNTKSNTNNTKSNTNSTKSNTNSTKSNTNNTKSNTNNTKSNTNNTKSNTNNTKSNTNNTKSNTNNTKSNTNKLIINKDVNQTKISHNKNKFLKNNSSKSISNKNEKNLKINRKSLNQFSKNNAKHSITKNKKSLNNKKLIHNDNFFSENSEQTNDKPSLNQQLIPRYFNNKHKKNNKKIPLKSLKDNFNVKVKTVNTFDRFNIDTDKINIKEARIYLFNNGIIKNQNIPDNIIIDMYIMFTNN